MKFEVTLHNDLLFFDRWTEVHSSPDVTTLKDADREAHRLVDESNKKDGTDKRIFSIYLLPYDAYQSDIDELEAKIAVLEEDLQNAQMDNLDV